MFFKVVIVLLPFLSIYTVVSSQNLEIVVSNTRLPSTRAYMPVVYDGEDSIYIWGGNSYDADGAHSRQDVLKFSVTAGTVDVIGSTMSSDYGSGVWAGNETLLYFGGRTSSSNYNSDVWNFKTNDPNSSWTSMANLPQPCTATTSVWDGGEYTYIIGGFNSGGQLDMISKYSSVTHRVDIVGEIPNRDRTSAIWDSTSQNLYIFGGWTGFVGLWNDILKYDSVNGMMTRLDAVLPVPSSESCAVWTGKEAFIIGGFTGSEELQNWPQLVRFDPQTNEVTEVDVNNFPDNLYGTGCVFVEKLNRIYIIGGRFGGAYRDEIMYIDL